MKGKSVTEPMSIKTRKAKGPAPAKDETPKRKTHAAQPTRRRAGGQPGNTNAFRHGWYSTRKVDLLETMAAPDTADGGDPTAEASLEHEIKLIRVVIQRCAELVDDADPARRIALLNTLGAAATRVGTLLKTQQQLTGNKDEIGEMIQQVLEEIMEENGFS